MDKLEHDPEYCLSEEDELKKIARINTSLRTLEIEIKEMNRDSLSYILTHGQKISRLMVKLYLKKEGYKIDQFPFKTILYYCSNEDILPENIINFLKTMQKFRNQGLNIKISFELINAYLETLNHFLKWFNQFYSQKYSIEKPFEITGICSLINQKSLLEIKENLDEYYMESPHIEIERILKNDLESYDNMDATHPDIKIFDEQYKDNPTKLYVKEEYLKKLDTEKIILEKESKQIDHRIKSLTKSKNQKEDIKKESDDNIFYERMSYELRKPEISIDTEINNLTLRKEILDDRLKNNITEKTTVEKEISDLNEKEIGNKLEYIICLLEKQYGIIINIDKKVDIIIDKIDNTMSALQSFVTRQINNTDSEEEKEKIRENFTNEYVENISTEYFNKITEEGTEYEREENRLRSSLGEDAWNKLSTESKTFLVTSRVMYNDLSKVDRISDFSGVCILVTKALEVEMFKRFFTEFMEYCKEKFDKDYSKYHTSLIHKGRNDKKDLLLESRFTMGNIAYVLNYKENRKDTNEEKRNNKKVLLEYCKDCVFSNKTDEEIKLLLNEYAENVELVRIDYRNPSAHRDELQKSNADDCFDLVLYVEKLLKKMLDSFEC